VDYPIKQIAAVIDAKIFSEDALAPITSVFIDSRSMNNKSDSLFFALAGSSNDGHQYISSLIEKGIRYFVVSDPSFIDEKATYLLVDNTTVALQELAAFHRQQFSIPIVGITGSNGKTIVKEWLTTSLENTETPIKTIGSYNSQVGVPLSVFQLNAKHSLGIFEAGISLKGEMEKLQTIINPTIGILTNIGTAHAIGFTSLEEKIAEKTRLFKDCEIIICNEEYIPHLPQNKTFTWGKEETAQLKYDAKISKHQLKLTFKTQTVTYTLPFTDDVSIENLMQVIAFHTLRDQSIENLQPIINQMQPVAMRLEIKN